MRRLVLIYAIAVLGACGAVPKDRFYVLAAPQVDDVRPYAAHTVAIGPVHVPELVDRPQLVLHRSDSRIDILEHERWAVPLRAAIPNAVAQKLRTQLPDTHIAVYPERAVASAHCRISMDVQRFESRRGESALIEALWSIRCEDGAVQSRRVLRRESVQGADYEALVAAHGRALAGIGLDIARAMRELHAAEQWRK